MVNMLTRTWCIDRAAGPVTATGVGYMQAACDREFNSDVFTCRSEPLWIGSGTKE